MSSTLNECNININIDRRSRAFFVWNLQFDMIRFFYVRLRSVTIFLFFEIASSHFNAATHVHYTHPIAVRQAIAQEIRLVDTSFSVLSWICTWLIFAWLVYYVEWKGGKQCQFHYTLIPTAFCLIVFALIFLTFSHCFFFQTDARFSQFCTNEEWVSGSKCG